MLKFLGKIVLITGGGTGIGGTVAKKFAENGASLIILGRRKEPLESTAEILKNIFIEVSSNAFVKVFSTDISNEFEITKLFNDLKKSNINIDIVINNAGVSGPVTCFSNMSLNDFRSTIDIHLTGTFLISSNAIKTMKSGSKIITISTFFTEERPLEQRPYRFRSPYTSAQGAKNRLVECMAWEMTNKGIISIATNPGPVHSDRIYKTVYPKAASEFLRISGFNGLNPIDVENINSKLLMFLGEDDKTAKNKIVELCDNIKISSNLPRGGLIDVVFHLYQKIKIIAEKIQINTSNMIVDGQFLSQSQVAEVVLNICDSEISKILNGRIIPGDRVFYPVKPHITTNIQYIQQPNFNSNVFILTVDAVDPESYQKADYIAEHIENNGGKVICLISKESDMGLWKNLRKHYHVHQADLSNHIEIRNWIKTAASKFGRLHAFIHITGNVVINCDGIMSLSKSEWDKLISRFIMVPAILTNSALEYFVPNGKSDPRCFNNKTGTIIMIGPDLPVGKKILGQERAKVEIFRGLLRPFTTTVNQELHDVLRSKLRLFLILGGSIYGNMPDNKKLSDIINYLSNYVPTASEVIYQIDETR